MHLLISLSLSYSLPPPLETLRWFLPQHLLQKPRSEAPSLSWRELIDAAKRLNADCSWNTCCPLDSQPWQFASLIEPLLLVPSSTTTCSRLKISMIAPFTSYFLPIDGRLSQACRSNWLLVQHWFAIGMRILEWLSRPLKRDLLVVSWQWTGVKDLTLDFQLQML